MVSTKQRETVRQQRSVGTAALILDAAEELMSAKGFHGVGIREIAKLAGVNLGSVTYFYGTKDNLLAAIYQRHTEPMNARRIELLSEAERIGNIDERLAAIIRAYIIPAFSSLTDTDGGGARFTRLRGIMSMEGNEAAKKIIADSFDEISELFLAAIARCVPKADRTSLVWRCHFLLGSLYYTLLTPERIDRLARKQGSGTDRDRAMDELVRASVASLKEAGHE